MFAQGGVYVNVTKANGAVIAKIVAGVFALCFINYANVCDLFIVNQCFKSIKVTLIQQKVHNSRSLI